MKYWIPVIGIFFVMEKFPEFFENKTFIYCIINGLYQGTSIVILSIIIIKLFSCD